MDNIYYLLSLIAQVFDRFYSPKIAWYTSCIVFNNNIDELHFDWTGMITVINIILKVIQTSGI